MQLENHWEMCATNNNCTSRRAQQRLSERAEELQKGGIREGTTLKNLVH